MGISASGADGPGGLRPINPFAAVTRSLWRDPRPPPPYNGAPSMTESLATPPSGVTEAATAEPEMVVHRRRSASSCSRSPVRIWYFVFRDDSPPAVNIERRPSSLDPKVSGEGAVRRRHGRDVEGRLVHVGPSRLHEQLVGYGSGGARGIGAKDVRSGAQTGGFGSITIAGRRSRRPIHR